MTAAGVVLAAGASRRMGSPKAALLHEGRTFVACVLGALHGAGVHDVVVVTGAAEQAIADALPAGAAVTLARNPDPERGQLSSLKTGLRRLTDVAPRADAVVVALVDHPAVASATVRALLDAAQALPGAAIVVPAHGGRRGHPVLFARALWAELLATPDESGARAVVRADPARVVEVAVDDRGILVDVDTPDDLRRLRAHPGR